MRNSVSAANDTGTLTHERRVGVGMKQSIIFLPNDLPLVFDPTAQQYNEAVPDDSKTSSPNKRELQQQLEDAGLNSDGDVKT